jgi:glutamate dehydrogenase (NAD(P)+)
VEHVFKFADELGPLKIIHVYEPSANLKGILVVDNVAAGPSIGGVRLAPDVSTEECFRLARAMTLKNAAAEIPHGGGKAVLFGDPKMGKVEKEHLIRAFACSLREVEQYIFGPDMGTDEECMAWIKDEVGRAVGLPRALGGIPLDEIGATGWGISHVAEVAIRFCDFELAGARIVVQGFGAVGLHAARFLTNKGAILVGAADSQGTIHHSAGLNMETLLKLKQQGKSVAEYPGGKKLDREAVINIECDIWIPAGRPDVIRKDNVQQLKTKLVIEGANIPVTSEAEKYLHTHGILCIPDFIANAGGVICAAMEYEGGNELLAFQSIEEKLQRNTKAVLEEAKSQQKSPREAALDLALRRVKKTMGYRRWSLF